MALGHRARLGLFFLHPSHQASLMRRAWLGLLVLSVPIPAAAADVDGPPQKGFGQRASFVFGVDNVVGFASERVGNGDKESSVDFSGIFPGYFGPRIGLHGIFSNGVTLGVNLGATFARLGSDGRDSENRFVTTLAPRIGYASSLKPTVGYWLRLGPSFRMIWPKRETDREIHVGLGFEALGVVTPVEHFGVTVGPMIDVGVFGDRDGQKRSFTTLGLGLGLLTDL